MYLWDDTGVRVDQLGRSGEFENGSLQRVPDGAGPNDGYDFNSSGGGDSYLDCVPTPGAMNGGFCFDGSVLSLTIPEIQGVGHLSPVAGFDVKTEGVVTAVAFDSFFVQDPDGDGDPATSDGMRVFMDDFCNGCPDVGDEVRLTDRVDEFIPGGASTGNLSATEMAFPSITVVSTGNDLPDPVIIGRGGRIAPNVITISEDELPVNLQDVPRLSRPTTSAPIAAVSTWRPMPMATATQTPSGFRSSLTPQTSGRELYFPPLYLQSSLATGLATSPAWLVMTSAISK
jgi:hypothetical protein